jgi:hypothetical protein
MQIESKENVMSKYDKVLLNVGLLSLLSVLPLTAQVGNGVEFKTSFPFYVGQTEMPAGSYSLVEPDDLDFHVIIVRSNDGLHTASTGVMATESIEPQTKSRVIFEKYGDTLYLDKVAVEGDMSGAAVIPTKVEKKAEEHAAVAEQLSITASGQ